MPTPTRGCARRTGTQPDGEGPPSLVAAALDAVVAALPA